MPKKCENIINALVDERHKKGLTQRDLANKCGFTQSVIARFESKKNTPGIDTILKVANALDLEIAVVPMNK